MHDTAHLMAPLDEALFTVGHIDRTYLISEVATLQRARGRNAWLGHDGRGLSAFQVDRIVGAGTRSPMGRRVTYSYVNQEGGDDTGRALRWNYRGSDGSRAVVYER
jgi:hypothetical protein